MSVVENSFVKGKINFDEIERFSALYRKLSFEFSDHFDEKLRSDTRLNQFVESIKNSVELAPSCVRYLDLFYHRNIPGHSLKAFTYQVDIVDEITGGPISNNGGNLRTHIIPRMNSYDLFHEGVLNNDKVNGRVSQLEVHHVGRFRSPSSLQVSDKRHSLEYEPRLKMEKMIVFEARAFKQMFSSSHIQDQTLSIDLANYLLLGRNIFLSIFSGLFDLIPKIQIKFETDGSGNVYWEERENPDYQLPWD